MPPDEPAGRPPSEAASPESLRLPRGRRPDIPAAGTSGGLAPRADSEGKTLTVPRSISYSGRIGSCERLMVEGAVETEIHGCRVLAVAANGVFRGSADVERADISGTVEGSLTVRELLTVRASARILSGSISYGELEIEGGGTVTSHADGNIRPRRCGKTPKNRRTVIFAVCRSSNPASSWSNRRRAGNTARSTTPPTWPSASRSRS